MFVFSLHLRNLVIVRFDPWIKKKKKKGQANTCSIDAYLKEIQMATIKRLSEIVSAGVA